MGILDEAIRQHLDLKRRQGAAEDELARLEGEAFGPPSRPGDPEFAAAGDPEPAELEEGSFYDQTAADEDLEQEDLDLELEADRAGDAEEGEPGWESDPALEAGAPQTAEHAAAASPAEAPGTAEHSVPIEAQDTVEHDVETELSHEAETEYAPLTDEEDEEELVDGALVEGEQDDEEDPEGEDVLEETPEFLRDQPEDDELWFEQGEPKDFDF